MNTRGEIARRGSVRLRHHCNDLVQGRPGGLLERCPSQPMQRHRYRHRLGRGDARLAALKATDEDVMELEGRLDLLRAAASDEERHHADQDFHREIARIAGNDLMLLTIDGITPLLYQLRRRAWSGWTKSGGTVEAIVEAHAVIYDRIKQRDADGAAEAMRAHLHQAYEGLRAPVE